MKRLFVILFTLTLALSLCGCAKTNIGPAEDVFLTFVYEGTNINVTLEGEEAEAVMAILDGNRYHPLWAGVPSCGFDPNISIKVGNQIFAIACDNCNFVQDFHNQRYFDITQKEMEQVRSMFEKYGGHFPCV